MLGRASREGRDWEKGLGTWNWEPGIGNWDLGSGNPGHGTRKTMSRPMPKALKEIQSMRLKLRACSWLKM